MDAERISKQSKGNVDQSLLEGTGSGGILSAGYFNDNSLIDRLHDGERVDYALQNLTKGVTVSNGDSDDTISPHSSYRTVLLVTDERLLYVVGQGSGDKTFSVRFEDIRDVEISQGVLKDRIIVQTDDETYDMYTQKGGSLDEASKHISEISEKKAKKSNESSGDEQVERTNKEVTDNDANKPPDRPEQSANVLNQSGRNRDSEENSSNSSSNMSVTVEILVSNIDGEPVPDARVKITGTTHSVDGRTSQTGRCSISFSEASESVKMEVNHPEYQTIQEGVTLADGAVIDITLKGAGNSDSHSDEKSRSEGTDSTETSDTSNGSPERTELLDELVALNERFSRKVTRGRMRTDGKYNPEDYETAFGSWSTAVDQASFDRTNESSSDQPNQQTYSRQDVIDALVDLIEKVDGRPSSSDMNDLGEMSASPVYQYFKSWDAAVDAAKEEHSAVESDHDRGQSEEYADDSDTDSPAKDTASEQSEDGDLTADQRNSEVSSEAFAELSGFRRDLLVVINGLEAPKGLEIKRELEDYYDGTIHHGRLYPNLDTLVEAGFLEKSAQDERSNRYELTGFGANHIEARYHWQQNRVATNENQTRTPEPEDRTTSETTRDDTLNKKEQPDNTYTENIPHDSATEDGEQDSNSELTEEDDFEWGVEESDTVSDDLGEVPEGRLSNVVAEVIKIRDISSGKRDSIVDIKLSNGKRIDFTIWNKHDIEIDFQIGDKLRLNEVRLKRWETDHGYAHQLSSTKDLTIVPIEGSGVRRPLEEDEEDECVSGESENAHDIDQLIGVGGATKADAEALMESGYMTTGDLENASLDDLRSVSGLDDGTALRIKAELG
jgi:DNA-binding PadR family transcriptional regulator